MNVTAYSEITGVVIRVFLDGGAPPAPFDLALDVVGHEGTAYLKALNANLLDGGFLAAHRRAIARELGRLKFHTAVWTRRKVRGDGTVHEREVRVPVTVLAR